VHAGIKLGQVARTSLLRERFHAGAGRPAPLVRVSSM
jgi:hypothetical protein